MPSTARILRDMKAGAGKIRLTHRLANVLRTRIAEPTVQLLKQGVTPRAIAASMATGAVIGIFPVLGTTTATCLAVALLLRLNLVTIQILNWLVYPLQVLLIIPFMTLVSGCSAIHGWCCRWSRSSRHSRRAGSKPSAVSGVSC